MSSVLFLLIKLAATSTLVIHLVRLFIVEPKEMLLQLPTPFVEGRTQRTFSVQLIENKILEKETYSVEFKIEHCPNIYLFHNSY